MQYSDTLQVMVGHVRRVKQTASPETVRDWLNYRMRSLLDMRPFWSGLIRSKVIAIPNPYSTGSVSLALGSPIVTGVSTAWPVDDFVSTVIPNAITQIGSQTVIPASMANITDDTVLYVDSAGTPEIVPVQQIRANGFTASFAYPHNAGATITSSTLVNQQFRMTDRTPIFDVIAVTSATSLVLSQDWGTAAASAAAYTILKMRIVVDSKIKLLMFCIDPVLGLPLKTNVPLGRLMVTDPWRQASGDPFWVVDTFSNFNSNFQYELYPPPTTQRQYTAIYATQWEDMVAPGDRPPPFMNPAILIDGALSDALRTKTSDPDPFVNDRQADHYEKKWMQGCNDLMYADNHKSDQALSFMYNQAFGAGGANFWASHTDCNSAYFGDGDGGWGY